MTTIDHTSKLTQALATALSEDYRIAAMPDGTYRVMLPQGKAQKRGVDYYTVDLLDFRTPCTCTAGRFGRRCRHLSMVEAYRIITEGTIAYA